MTTDRRSNALLSTEDLIIGLFCRVDDTLEARGLNRTHSQASLALSELITLALLAALTGKGPRPFYRWLSRDWGHLFPDLPERTRLFRRFNTHRHLTDAFLAEPTLISVIDTYGIELIHPRREGRSEAQIGKKGLSNQRWIVGGKLCYVLNHLGLIVAWDCDTANVYDGSAFQQIVDTLDGQTVIFADTGFAKKDWKPEHVRLCKRGTWNVRMVVETVLSMLTRICHFKRVSHRAWAYFRTRLASTMALFNVLVQWHGFEPDDEGFVRLSIAEFGL